MILHVYVADKFIPPYVNFINRNFPSEEHVHFIVNRKNRYTFEDNSNLIIVSRLKVLGLFKLQALFRQADKVIFHGLFWERIVLLLALNFRRLEKCYWVMWGGDLYRFKSRNKTFSSRAMHRIRRFVISRLGHFVTYLPGDYEVAKQWYGAKGKYQECIMYLSNVFNMIPHTSCQPRTDDKKNVLLGNSASASNRHLEALRFLLPFKNKIRIYAPLTYGNMKHGRKVIEEGKSLYNEDFVALTNHLPLEEYYLFLETIDIVVFNHDRQQGMGNLIQLLGLGKKVFIDFSTPQKCLFDILGVTVYDVTQIDLVEMDESKKKDNQANISGFFTKERLKDQWESIFRS